jgi:hypothetical protein
MYNEKHASAPPTHPTPFQPKRKQQKINERITIHTSSQLEAGTQQRDGKKSMLSLD